MDPGPLGRSGRTVPSPAPVNEPKVLVFIDWYKPFFKAGGPVRSMVNLVEHLGERVQFHIVTGDRDYTATAAPPDLSTDQWTDQDKGEHVWYASPQGRTAASWRKILKAQRWDVVYINGLYSRWSTIMPLWLLRGTGQRRIVAVRGMLAAGPMRQGGVKKRLFLRVMKALGCFRDVEFQATNAEETADIRRWIGANAVVHQLPNLGRKVDMVPLRPLPKRPGTVHLVSVARIALEKNTLFAIEQLRGLKGDVRFDLYGTIYDEAYWHRCKEAIAALPSNVQVKWHGEVASDQVPEILSRAHALFMPSVGENFGHTMLEALTAGRPLLISDRTPWKDLEAASAGWDIPLEEPQRFEEVLNALLAMDQENFEKLIAGSFALARRSLDDPTAKEGYIRMFRSSQ